MLTINSTNGIVGVSIFYIYTFMFHSRLLVLIYCFLLMGCESTTNSEYYLFGWGNSCFKTTINKNCTKLKAYDSVKLSINLEKQTVTYVQKAYNLNNTNTIFKTIDDCKVVDKENFKCDGLVKADGKFVNSDIFKNKFITDSYLLSLTSYFDAEVDVSNFKFVNENSALVSFGVIVLVGLFIIGLTS